nr:chitosanase [uncultured bacterium]
MQLTAKQRRVIDQVVNVFETGTPAGDYACISIYSDGPGDARQITYGRSQTTEYSKLRDLIERYLLAGGLYAAALAPYVARIGVEPLVDDDAFKDLLRAAGREDPIMRSVQDAFFDERYFQPAMAWADENQLVLPLSALVIYDSFIHSGSILWTIRETFWEEPPVLGGSEKGWVRDYVQARHRWLATHRREILHKTTYRTACLAHEIARDNWHLDLLPIEVNGRLVHGD